MKIFLSLLTLTGIFLAPLQAATLYSHSFGGLDTVDLHGVTPDISVTDATHSTGGNWAAATGEPELNADGSVVSVGNQDGTAALVFVPVHGYVYTLTMNATVDTDWAAMGFSDEATGATTNMAQNGILWGLTSKGGQSFFAKPTGGTDSAGGYTDTTGTAKISVVLDTRDGTSGWDVNWLVDDVVRATLTDISSAYENKIKSVAISWNTSSGEDLKFDNLEFTAVIPEPSSLALIGISAVAAMFVCRRRRR